MKKLIISMVATASIALVAKADVEPLNATSFEDYSDFSVDKTEADEYYWSGYRIESERHCHCADKADLVHSGNIDKKLYKGEKSNEDKGHQSKPYK